jgi:hypothetical protein
LLEEILPKNNLLTDYVVEHDFPHIGRKTVLLNACRLYGDGENTLLAIEDVTERKRLERELQTRNDCLEQADHRKDEFLAVLSHELRNPLAPVRNAVQIITQQKADDPILQQACNILERQVRVMTRLVDDLLDVSRITSGKLQLCKELVEVSVIVERAVEMTRPLIEAHKHRLSLTLPKNPLWLQADPIRLGGARHQVRRFLWLFGRVCDRGGAAAAEGGVSALRALAISVCARSRWDQSEQLRRPAAPGGRMCKPPRSRGVSCVADVSATCGEWSPCYADRGPGSRLTGILIA